MKLDDKTIISNAAALDRVEYDRQRKGLAYSLKISLGVFDQEVNEERKRLSKEEGKNFVKSVEPWPEIVNGAEVLNEIRENVVNRYLFLPPHYDVIVSLFIAFTHVYHCFIKSPRMVISSTDPECGKSVLIDVIYALSQKPLRADDLSAAVFFRVVEDYSPTILFDEFDSAAKRDDDIKNVFNSGWRKGGCTLRCTGDQHEVSSFNTFCPLVIAGINTKSLHPTMLSRSFIIKMSRAKPFEIPAEFDERYLDKEAELASKLARWAQDNEQVLKDSNPVLHQSLRGRTKEKWFPFFSIADCLGGQWPELVMNTVEMISTKRSLSFKEKILSDIKRVFGDAEEVSSEKLTAQLNELEGRSYCEMGFDNKGVTKHWVASMLAGYEIRPCRIDMYEEGRRIQKRGYKKEMFTEAWSRYLYDEECSSFSPPDSQTVTPSQVSDRAGFKANTSVTSEIDVTHSSSCKDTDTNGCDTVTLSKRLNGLKDIIEQATEGLSISAQDLFDWLHEDDLQDIRNGDLKRDDLRQVAKDCQGNFI